MRVVIAALRSSAKLAKTTSATGPQPIRDSNPTGGRATTVYPPNGHLYDLLRRRPARDRVLRGAGNLRPGVPVLAVRVREPFRPGAAPYGSRGVERAATGTPLAGNPRGAVRRTQRCWWAQSALLAGSPRCMYFALRSLPLLKDHPVGDLVTWSGVGRGALRRSPCRRAAGTIPSEGGDRTAPGLFSTVLGAVRVTPSPGLPRAIPAAMRWH